MNHRLFVPGTITIRSAMLKLEETAEKILFVVSENRVLEGSLTDGDIRRCILKGGNLEDVVSAICNPHPYFVTGSYDVEHVRVKMLDSNIECIPVVDANKVVLDLLFWKEIFGKAIEHKPKGFLDIPIVIMAGGMGTRLAPFTTILPKPLIPIGDKSMLEVILDQFLPYGVNHFFFSVNHKSKIIKSYFEELEPPYGITYVHESSPLGTVGSLGLIKNQLKGSLLLTNCDVLIQTDYNELLDFHRMNENLITVVASLKYYRIPYGICEIGALGELTQISEKPEFNFLVNTGMYIIESEILDLIPPDQEYHATHLIDAVKEKGGKVGVFPVGENAWRDTGEWAEYRKVVERLGE